jgi:hypothetical protein
VSLFSRITLGLAVFLGAAGLIYAITSSELVGGVLLLLASAGFAYIGVYVRRAIRTAAREAEGAPGVEEEPHVAPTIWPFVFSLAGVGLVLGAVVNRWVLAIGGALFVAAGIGWFADVGRQWTHGREHR